MLVSSLCRALRSAPDRLLVLTYHRVHASTDAMFPREVTADVFRWQMEAVARYLSPVALEEAIERRAEGRLGRNSVAVTFDDGYRDNFEIALPILREVGIPATFFVATGFLDGGRMWNDTVIESARRVPSGDVDLRDLELGVRNVSHDAQRRQLALDVIMRIKHEEPGRRAALAGRLERLANSSLPTDLMMTRSQVHRLSETGMTVGAHTVTHPILRVLPDSEADREICDGRDQLRAITGRQPRLFAYPNGRPGDDYVEAHCRMVAAAGFRAAFSTRRGAICERSDRWQLPRFASWDRTPRRFIARLLLEFRNAA